MGLIADGGVLGKTQNQEVVAGSSRKRRQRRGQPS